MLYNRCGRSGIKLPAVSLGLWHNFGDFDDPKTARAMLHRAFDMGITHFDLANNYGPPPGAAEAAFGRALKSGLGSHRDEIVVSSKAGYPMWDGPYGDWGSRKHLVASLDQSLGRMGIDYVDIFYHHRPDLETPLEETMGALDFIVRSGRALYAGISNYQVELSSQALSLLRDLGTPCLIHQLAYNMFRREPEAELFPFLQMEGIGVIVFSPLAQGLLTEKYLAGIPKNSRAAKPHGFLKPEHITEAKLGKIRQLQKLALKREQSLAQMAIAWTLRLPAITSALVGASTVAQLEQSIGSLEHLAFNGEELDSIDQILT